MYSNLQNRLLFEDSSANSLTWNKFMTCFSMRLLVKLVYLIQLAGMKNFFSLFRGEMEFILKPTNMDEQSDGKTIRICDLTSRIRVGKTRTNVRHRDSRILSVEWTSRGEFSWGARDIPELIRQARWHDWSGLKNEAPTWFPLTNSQIARSFKGAVILFAPIDKTL